MNRLWQVRIAIAKKLLGAGPQGYDYFFKGKRLYVRQKVDGALRAAVAQIVSGQP